MEKLISIIEKTLVPVANKLSQNKYLLEGFRGVFLLIREPVSGGGSSGWGGGGSSG